MLGIIGYYARYIKGYATLVEPLTTALKRKNRKEAVGWTPEMEKAFIAAKRKLTESPVLYAPDYNCEFILQSDSSEKELGVVLAQKKNGEDHPIIYLSCKFTGPEKTIVLLRKNEQRSFTGLKTYDRI